VHPIGIYNCHLKLFRREYITRHTHKQFLAPGNVNSFVTTGVTCSVTEVTISVNYFFFLFFRGLEGNAEIPTDFDNFSLLRDKGNECNSVHRSIKATAIRYSKWKIQHHWVKDIICLKNISYKDLCQWHYTF